MLFRSPLRWYGGFVLVACFSILVAINRLYSAFFSYKLVVVLLVVVVLIEQADRKWWVVVEDVLVVHIYLWLLIAALYVFAPASVLGSDSLVGYRLTGGRFADYGAAAMMAGLWLLTRLLYGKPKHRTLIFGAYLASFVFVLLSRTRSTIAAAIVIAILCAVLHDKVRVRLGVVWIIVGTAAVLLLVGAFPSIQEFLLRGQDAETVSTLSGREGAFDYLIAHWRERPIMGYGYAIGGRYLLTAYSQQFDVGIGAAHDALSKVLAETGLLGCIFLGLAFVTLWKRVAAGVRLRQMPMAERLGMVRLAGITTWLTLASFVSGGVADVSLLFAVCVVAATLNWTDAVVLAGDA